MTGYELLKQAGICVECAKNTAEPHKVRCYECNDKHKERSKLTYKKRGVNTTHARRKALGLCVQCGSRKPESNKTRCAFCLAKERNRRRNSYGQGKREYRQENDLCYICGAKRYKDSRLCKECYENACNNIAKGRQKQKEKGKGVNNDSIFL